jgi:hypothetical protein
MQIFEVIGEVTTGEIALAEISELRVEGQSVEHLIPLPAVHCGAYGVCATGGVEDARLK